MNDLGILRGFLAPTLRTPVSLACSPRASRLACSARRRPKVSSSPSSSALEKTCRWKLATQSEEAACFIIFSPPELLQPIHWHRAQNQVHWSPQRPNGTPLFEDSQFKAKNEKTCHFILGLFSQTAHISTRRNSFLSSIESGTALTALISTEASIAAFLLSCSAWRPAFAQESSLRMLPSDPEA